MFLIPFTSSPDSQSPQVSTALSFPVSFHQVIDDLSIGITFGTPLQNSTSIIRDLQTVVMSTEFPYRDELVDALGEWVSVGEDASKCVQIAGARANTGIDE